MGPQDWGALVAICATALGAVSAFHYNVVRPALRTFRQLNDLVPTVHKLAAELSPNGGLSIKDRITNIDNAVRQLKFHDRLEHDRSENAIFECDAAGQCCYANAAFASLFGMDREELLGRGWLAAVNPEARLDQWELWIGAVENKIPYGAVYEIQNRVTRKKFIVKATAHAILGGNGEPIRYFGTIVPHPDRPIVELTPQEISLLKNEES